jgi:hypothetical protein
LRAAIHYVPPLDHAERLRIAPTQRTLLKPTPPPNAIIADDHTEGEP